MIGFKVVRFLKKKQLKAIKDLKPPLKMMLMPGEYNAAAIFQ